MAVNAYEWEYAVRAVFLENGSVYELVDGFDSLEQAATYALNMNLTEGDELARGEITPDIKCHWTVVRRIKPVEPGEWEEF